MECRDEHPYWQGIALAGEEKQEEMRSMTRRPPARRRPAVDTAPRSDVVQSNTSARTSGGFTTLLESAAQEILAVTYWFDPALHPGPYPVTVRFSGHRVDVKGRLLPGDRFVHDETIQEVVPGSGPISLTARGSRESGNVTPVAGRGGPAARFWRRWAPSVGSAEPVRTCLTPFARVPGILPGIWGVMVTLGIAVALAIQSLVIAGDHLAVGPVWTVSLVAIVVGIVGAKVWFIVLHRREH